MQKGDYMHFHPRTAYHTTAAVCYHIRIDLLSLFVEKGICYWPHIIVVNVQSTEKYSNNIKLKTDNKSTITSTKLNKKIVVNMKQKTIQDMTWIEMQSRV
jgi:hypothetical protein